MPLHDWSRIDPGTFHHFHQSWTVELANRLNAGVLPAGFFALTEQVVSGPIPDVVTLERLPSLPVREGMGGLAVADSPPQAAIVATAEMDMYAERANRIVVKHRFGEVIAVVEIVSPGNKASQRVLRSFVAKAVELLRAGVHLLIVDLLPPTPRDPQGLHKVIWDEFQDEPFALPPGKPLIVAAYRAGEPLTAYVQPLGVGDSLPSLPLFLSAGRYVPAPLEETYLSTWQKCPAVLREALLA